MSESIEIESNDDKCKKTDFVSVGGNIISNINLKVAFFIFLLGMVIFSDIFITILGKFSSANVDGSCTTTQGTFIQLLLLVIGYIILDLLVSGGYI